MYNQQPPPAQDRGVGGGCMAWYVIITKKKNDKIQKLIIFIL